jgi:hypothetical protein
VCVDAYKQQEEKCVCVSSIDDAQKIPSFLDLLYYLVQYAQIAAGNFRSLPFAFLLSLSSLFAPKHLKLNCLIRD